MMNTYGFNSAKTGWLGKLRGAGQGQKCWPEVGAGPGFKPGPGQARTWSGREPPTIDGVTGHIDGGSGGGSAETGPGSTSAAGRDWLRYVPAGVRDLVTLHLPQGLPDMSGHGFVPPLGTVFPSGVAPVASRLPEGAQFLSGSFTNAAGSRPYKLYVPSGYAGQPMALVVMLHGCTQSPDDFAAGTGMNEVAEQQNFLVLYPGQTASAHAQKCWKWFDPEDQRRDSGEPSLIAGMTRQMMQDYAVDVRRVYVAGLSAGGAAAAVMAETYPDLYAAAGVHSGLACGAARDLPSALAAMRGGASGEHRNSGSRRRCVPTIVFHGDRDSTVSARNAEHVVGQALGGASTRTEVQAGQTVGGHAYTRTIQVDEAGKTVTEQWMVHGAGHAWSGGSKTGSYTDPRGPDATQEMLRFFWAHPHAAPAG